MPAAENRQQKLLLDQLLPDDNAREFSKNFVEDLTEPACIEWRCVAHPVVNFPSS